MPQGSDERSTTRYTPQDLKEQLPEEIWEQVADYLSAPSPDDPNYAEKMASSAVDGRLAFQSLAGENLEIDDDAIDELGDDEVAKIEKQAQSDGDTPGLAHLDRLYEGAGVEM